MMDELNKIAEHVAGTFCEDELYIRIDTGDNTTKENYDALLDIVNDIEPMLKEYEINDTWADHDTQIIEFNKKIQQYCLGFVFSTKGNKVLLINKTKPDWQKGKLNGIGGKIEEFDLTPHDAMVREFKEETGLDIPEHKFRSFGKMIFGEKFVHLFVAYSDLIFLAKQTTEELPEVFNYPEVLWDQSPIIKNLKWLLPLAIQNNFAQQIHIEAEYKWK